MASSVERSISDELQALLECPICMEPLKEPRSLPCFHNFCKTCLTNYVAGLRGENIEQFPCPTCRSQFTLKSNENVEGMPGNYFIRNMLEVMSTQQQAKASKCECCVEDAVSRCMNCGKFPLTKKHTMLSLSELNDPEGEATIKSKLYCEKHQNKTLKFYCETSKELSCTRCMVLTHNKQNHSCVSVEEIAQKQREMLQSSCETIDEKLSEGKKALDDIARVMKSQEENASAARKKIREEKENILKKVAAKLDEREKELVKEVDDIYEESQTELKKQHNEIKQYVDEVQATNLKGCHDLLQSSILKGEIAFIEQLQQWLGYKCGWNLCYRASLDGWGARDFHRHCNNKGPTVTLIKVKNFVFGGFTDQSWAGDRKWKCSTSSFLFSLRNNENLAPFIAKLKPDREEYAIYCYPGYGPTFGQVGDLHICDNPHANLGSLSNLNSSYQAPSGAQNPRSLLAGSYSQFTVNEIEVYF